jgi:sodium transport system ATP-binding protein
MLEVTNLHKLFKKQDKKTKEITYAGIHDISFTAKPGRIFGLIGANGAGKTTTMRILADLTSPQSGSVKLDGKTYKQIREIKKRIGFVSGETQIFDRLTPHETMSIFGELAGMSHSEVEQRIDQLAHQLQMQEFMNLPVNNFSTGMKQKISIARALVTDPQVLIFDEITNGLDIFAAKAVKDIIAQLRDSGKIILFSTHIMPDADDLCDDVAIVHKGNVVIEGARSKLLEEHKVDSLYDLFFKLIADDVEAKD